MKESTALELIEARGRFGQRLGLETMQGMLADCGNFHERLRVVHVAGTNGKGTVCALIAAGLQAAGHKTGLYTSPHLMRFHERIRINGEDVAGKTLARAMEAVAPALEKFPEATYFEVATLVALRCFLDAGVDIVVLETGLGGRLDATNVFGKPLATVVTNVTPEHTKELGKDVATIAGEKAGIVKPGVTLVTGATGDALTVLREVAKTRDAPIQVLGEEFIFIAGETAATSQTFEVSGLRDWGEVRIPLRGEHQLENATLALATLDVLDAAGVRVPVEAARLGVAGARWPGRLQEFPGPPRLLLDGAHNPAGALALARFLETLPQKPVLVFGALSDKEWLPMVESLAPVVRDAIVTRPPSTRALDPPEAAREFSRAGVIGMVIDDPGQAMRAAEGLAGPDGIIVVTGSLYLVGEVLARLGKR